MSALPRINASSPVVIHALHPTTLSEERIHTQERTTTTEKVSDVAECIICYDERITEQTPQLIHQTNQDCDLYKNKQVCHICIPKLDRCPVCRENLTTGEMQNSLADILVEMQQNDLQIQEEGEGNQLVPIAQHQQPFAINININAQNPNPTQEQRYRCSYVHFSVSATVVISLAALGFVGWLWITARDHTA
jgi:hypothetical protein